MDIKDKIVLLKKIALSIVVFGLFTLAVSQDFFKPIDLEIGSFLIKFGEQSYNQVFYLFRFLGHFNPSLLILIGISFLAFKMNLRKFAFSILIIFFALTAAGYGFKIYVNRQRPVKEFYRASYEKEMQPKSNRNAYPSGHTLRSTYLMLALGSLFLKMRLRRWVRMAIKGTLYLIIFLAAFSSVCIGVHWISDVIGGFILAYIFYLILLFITAKSQNYT